MLGDKDVTAVIAVRDMEKAKKFYQDVLGLKPGATNDPGGMSYGAGSCEIFIYKSDYAGTNQATALNWNVGDELNKIIDDLKSKGVTFEHYDMPGVAMDGDVHVMGMLRSAWFKDPDGNILNIASGI